MNSEAVQYSFQQAYPTRSALMSQLTKRLSEQLILLTNRFHRALLYSKITTEMLLPELVCGRLFKIEPISNHH
jgi:hypothetical protein